LLVLLDQGVRKIIKKSAEHITAPASNAGRQQSSKTLAEPTRPVLY